MSLWNPDDLTSEQEAAILEPGSVFLIACPGSGKTRTLTYKLAYELSRLGSEKQRVVAITYTNRAADEIRDRIEALGIPTENLWIGTIHAFCLEWILRPYGIYHAHLKFGFSVISPHDAESILEEQCRTQNRGIRLWDCGHYFTPSGLKLACKAHQRAYVLDIIHHYHAHLEAERLLDFELILQYSHELVLALPSIPKLLSSIFAFILVDEYQDTKEIQYEILGAILRAGATRVHGFVVGDPNQAIFGSLGGFSISPADFSRIANLPFVERTLSGNYRSSTRIVDYFANFNLHHTPIVATGEYRDFESTITYGQDTTHEGLLDEIVRLIRLNIEERGISPEEICVLAPQWPMLASITRRLVAALPEYDFDGPGMVPFARDPENFWYKLSRIALTSASPVMYVKRLRWATEILAELRTAGLHLEQVSAKALLKISNSFRSVQQDGLEYLAEYFDNVFEILGLDYRNVPSLLSHYEAFFASSHARIQKIEQQGVESIRDITTFRKVFAEKRGVTISTIHGVKGGEYDVVIAYGLLQGMVPHFNDPEPVDSASKLMYVICSRARKHLHLLSEAGRPLGRSGTYSPTQILHAVQHDYDL